MSDLDKLQARLAQLPENQQALAQILIDWLQEIAPALELGYKWNAPNFSLDGQDRITFNFPPKGQALRLVLHRGAKSLDLPKEKLIQDPAKLLSWPANDRALLQIKDQADWQKIQADAKQLVLDWLEACS